MKGRYRFLSRRIGLMAFLQAVTALLLVCACLLAAGANAGWSLVLISACVCQAALALCFYLRVLRPYFRSERMFGFFLEGYTLESLEEMHLTPLSPTSERLVDRIREDFNASHLLKLSKRQAQYRALQNQINPHFLYNTLESIRSEALIAGLSSVADMTEALAVFFRYTISKVENLVSVEEEVQNCETYFRIQQYRFGQRLQLAVRCAPEDRADIYRCRIPKLTLQPILENGIIHGTEEKVGAGRLTVLLERTDRLLKITVSDDGAGMDEATLSRLSDRLDKSGRAFQEEREEAGGGVALVNVNNRIHLLFGEQYGLHVYSMPDVGTDVQIVLPMIVSDREVIRPEVLP